MQKVDSLFKGVEPKQWKWLATHECEYRLNENDYTTDRTKVCNHSELKSSMLFKVFNEHNRTNDDD